LVENRDPVVHLDRNFWIVTGVLAVLSAVSVWYFGTLDIVKLLPESATPAEQIDALTRFLLMSSGPLFVFVIGYLLYFTIAYRVRTSDPPDAIGTQIHDSHSLELWWTVIPTIFVVIMAIFSVKIWYGIEIAQPNNGIVVESIGHQWFYTFRYDNVHGEIPDAMHLEVNVPVTLHVTSSDVIHSFWVPTMRIKADMVPGLINTLHFTPRNPGTYKIICTEFCGTLHGEMEKQTVVIEDHAHFQAWYAGWVAKTKNVSDALPKAGAGAISLAGGDASEGKALFATKCSACHKIAPFDQKVVGPGLKGLLDDPAHPNLVTGQKATPENIAAILQHGYNGALGPMPDMTANGLSDKDIANLVEFLKNQK
jgi:cytochrome c oxidase subunit 2